MHAPSTSELRAAIQVLTMLGERIKRQAVHSVIQLPDTQIGDQYAAQIKVRASEQISRIEAVSAQLAELV